jgi:glyoxylase-like metal-dependent hydrolase (beta-lactamase superfamily II)
MRVLPDGTEEWSSPGIFEVVPGVYRVPLPLPSDGLRAVNVYALTTGAGVVLIDSGWAIPDARRLLAEAFDALGWSFTDVERFLITHVHRDHYTQAVHLRREFGTSIGLGIGEQPAIEAAMDPTRVPLQHQLMQLRRAGAGALADHLAQVAGIQEDINRLDFERPDHWFTQGEVVTAGARALDVVPTPGHTQGHVVFHDVDGGLLFAGDHVLPTITPSIGFEPVTAPNPLGDFLLSLAAVRARPDATLLPAHGPVTASVHQRVDELVHHHGGRLEQTEVAVAAGAHTAFEVAGRLRWTRRERSFTDLDPYNQMLAVSETGAHLELLLVQGRLSSAEEQGVRRFRTSSGGEL